MDKKTNYELPKLPYDLSDLQPIITKDMLDIHYNKHHAGYVKKLNLALDEYHLAEKNSDIAKMLNLQSKIKFNGGGHVNHSLFWKNLAPISSGKNKPSQSFEKILEANFGSFQNFIEQFTNVALNIQGSGWAWLGFNKMAKQNNVKNSLEIVFSQNHDSIGDLGLIPLFIIDVWEHAYYLKYKNDRGQFLKDIWQIVNFDEVEKRYEKALL